MQDDNMDRLEMKVLAEIVEDTVSILRHLKSISDKHRYFVYLEKARRERDGVGMRGARTTHYTWVFRILKEVYEYFLSDVSKVDEPEDLPPQPVPPPRPKVIPNPSSLGFEMRPLNYTTVMKALERLDLGPEVDAMKTVNELEEMLVRAQLDELEAVD